jgi:hypothetical protein
VSDYGLDDRATRGSIPTGAVDFSSSRCVQTGSGAHPASYPMGTGGSFPGGKARPGRDADHSPHLVPRLSMSRSYTSSPPMACSGTALLFFFYFFCYYRPPTCHELFNSGLVKKTSWFAYAISSKTQKLSIQPNSFRPISSNSVSVWKRAADSKTHYLMRI